MAANSEIRLRAAKAPASVAAEPLESADGRRDPVSKLRHIDACLTQPVEYSRSTGLEAYEFVNEALPELSLGTLDTTVTLAGRRLAAPLMIAPMTGGTEAGRVLNRRLAAAAQQHGLAMSVGSQRIAIERPDCADTYRVRDLAPTIALFANLGGAQLVRGFGAAEARRAVEMIGADALFIHLNAVQEAIQGGDRDFRGLAVRLSAICRALGDDGIPVFAREVCFGLSENAARRLVDCGVAGIDCSGAGGTSWAKVEAYCAPTARRRELGLRFGEWGIETSRSIRNVRAASAQLPLIASGGLRSGIDLAKALALGADVGAMARPFLLAAQQGDEAIEQLILDLIEELRICMFATGAGRLEDLRGRLVAREARAP